MLNGSKERNLLFLIVAITALTQAAVALYLPAMVQIENSFHTTHEVMKFSISLYFFGSAIAQLVYGPLSDHYGRKPMLLIGMLIFIIGCIIAALSPNPTVLIISRLIQGLGAGAALTLGRSILRDTYSPEALPKAMSFLSVAYALGLGLSPLLGSLIQSTLGWRDDFYALAAYGICLILLVTFAYRPGTHKKPQAHESWRPILANSTFWKYTIGGMFVYSIITTYSTMSAFLLENRWHFSDYSYAFVTFGVGVFYFIGAHFNKKHISRHGISRITYFGALLLLLCGLVLVVADMFNEDLATLLIISALVVSAAAQGLMFTNMVAHALMPFKGNVGSASALMTFLQILYAGVFSSVLALITSTAAAPIGFILMGISAAILLCITLWRSND